MTGGRGGGRDRGGDRAPRRIEVVHGGAATTVQDLGRVGWRGHGVPTGGAADPWAARAANRLVGNPDGAALLEIALVGPTLRFAAATRVAFAGEAWALRAGAATLPAGETVALAAGAELRIEPLRGAVRGWLAVAGGVDRPELLGSRSTELGAGFGGFEGRALRAGDRLELGPAPADSAPRRLTPALRRALTEPRLRVLSGPDAGRIGSGGAGELAAAPFRVGARSDRRGVRLEGRRLAARDGGEARSQGVLPGAVQLPGSGEPIVLGVDAPVTGGYPWIAQVIEADLGRAAHLGPGAEVSFELVDFDAAERALARLERELSDGIEAA